MALEKPQITQKDICLNIKSIVNSIIVITELIIEITVIDLNIYFMSH